MFPQACKSISLYAEFSDMSSENLKLMLTGGLIIKNSSFVLIVIDYNLCVKSRRV
jgi:hypothetical protein